MIVILREQAFCSIVISSLNVHPKEWFGLLIGHTDLDEFAVDHVIPILSAKSGYESVDPYGPKLDRVRRLIPKLVVGRELLGDVHSHPGRPSERAFPAPSKTDIGASWHGGLYLIAAINAKSRHQDWRSNSDGSLSGTIDRYHVRLAAHCLSGTGKDRCTWVPIVCPFALGLGRENGGRRL